jgi:hypothetical protein
LDCTTQSYRLACPAALCKCKHYRIQGAWVLCRRARARGCRGSRGRRR